MTKAFMIGCATFAAAAALAGCARQTASPWMERPVLTTAPSPEREPTLLERFDETCRLYNAERTRATALADELSKNKEALGRATVEAETLRQQVAVLTLKADELDALRTHEEQTQEVNLELEKVVRTLRRDLLEERLKSTRQEQTILALKIERAMETRKQALLGKTPETAAATPARPQENVADATIR